MRRCFRLLSGALLALTATTVLADGVVSNGSFESPALAAGAYQYSPSGATWSFGNNGSGGSGLTAANSGFTSGAPEIPLGNQVAFLQNQGYVSQQVPYSPNSILTFTATQRVNYGSAQTIQVLVNGVAQPFVLGDRNGASTTYFVTPPTDRYDTYAVKLSAICTGGCPSTVTLKIAGTVASGDATAFIDTVDISTPSNHAYGFWDPGLTTATWRSDYPTATASPTYGACYFQNSADPSMQLNCKSPSIATYPNTNWYTSTDYVQGGHYWQLAWNSEWYNNSSCASGPPDQSIPMVGSFRAPGAYMGVQSIYNPLGYYTNFIGFSYTTGTLGTGCIPYQSFGANARHGNGKPLAILDKAGYYRPSLSFYAAPSANNNSAAIGCARLLLVLGGFDDNIDRFLFIDLDCRNLSPEPNTFITGETWNWPIKNSSYYPGAYASFIGASNANSMCGLNLPAMSLLNASSGGTYSVDLYKLVSCVASQPAQATTHNGTSYMIYPWYGSAQLNQLPDPVIINRVEFVLESSEAGSQNLGVTYNQMNIR